MPTDSSRVSDRRRARRATAADRRYHTRIRLDLLVNRFLNGHPFMCRMTDISRTGARLVPLLEPQSRLAPPPRFMGLQFQLPGRSEVLTASGELIPDEDLGDDSAAPTRRTVGVRFTNLPPDAAWAIEAFLEADVDA
jgi:PilZ domain